MFVAPVIKRFADQPQSVHTEGELNKLVRACPLFQENPLLDGTVIVLDREDAKSHRNFSLIQVSKCNFVEPAVIGAPLRIRTVSMIHY
jgi:hypothetical protein